MTASVVVDSLCRSYGDLAAVDGVSFEVHRGEIFGLLGENGAGKTTTVEIAQGLRRADSGTVRVLGLEPRRDRDELRRRIGSQLQDCALPDRIRVGEALRLFASATPGARPWRELMSEWGLAEKERSSYADLSGGQRQRLFIALALVNDPELVFLDELTTGLDPAARRSAWDLVEQVRDRGTTVVLVTHFMDEAERLCDRLAVYRRGRIVALGRPGELLRDHGGSTLMSWTAGQDSDLSWLDRLPGATGVTRDGPRVELTGETGTLLHLGHALVERGLPATDLRVHQPTLEEVFLRLTGESE